MEPFNEDMKFSGALEEPLTADPTSSQLDIVFEQPEAKFSSVSSHDDVMRCDFDGEVSEKVEGAVMHDAKHMTKKKVGKKVVSFMMVAFFKFPYLFRAL